MERCCCGIPSSPLTRSFSPRRSRDSSASLRMTGYCVRNDRVGRARNDEAQKSLPPRGKVDAERTDEGNCMEVTPHQSLRDSCLGNRKENGCLGHRKRSICFCSSRTAKQRMSAVLRNPSSSPRGSRDSSASLRMTGYCVRNDRVGRARNDEAQKSLPPRGKVDAERTDEGNCMERNPSSPLTRSFSQREKPRFFALLRMAVGGGDPSSPLTRSFPPRGSRDSSLRSE